MKIGIPITALFLLLGSNVVSLAMGPITNPDEALAVASVQGYMSALIAGDMAQVRTYLAPKLLAERKSLLDNPTYPQRLQEAYGDASYEVVGYELLDFDKVQVDVKIQLNPQDAIHSRFILVRMGNAYRIIAEQ